MNVCAECEQRQDLGKNSYHEVWCTQYGQLLSIITSQLLGTHVQTWQDGARRIAIAIQEAGYTRPPLTV